MKKKLIFLALIIIVCGLLVYFFSDKGDKDELLFSKVKNTDLVQSIEATGEVSASNLVAVGAQASGQIKELFVDIGDEVKKGQVIVQIDKVNQQNALDRIKAEIIINKARLKQYEIAFEISQKQFLRKENLFNKGAISKEEFENAKNAFTLAKTNLIQINSIIEQNNIELKTAKSNLGYTTIVSPLNGTVLSVPIELGQTINSTQIAPTVANIADLSKMKIKMKISEADISKIKIGDKVEYSILSDLNKKYYAKISSIDPGLTLLSDGRYQKGQDNGAIYYYANFDVNNSSNVLRIGMTTQNKIIIKEIKNALSVPIMAIKNDEKGPYVLVKSNDEIVKKRVKIGLSSAVNVQILSGVNEGDEVVISQLTKEQIAKMTAWK